MQQPPVPQSNEVGGWGPPPPGGPRGQQQPPNWGSGPNNGGGGGGGGPPGAPRGGGWDNDSSPTMSRRPPPPGGDDAGTSLWGNKPPIGGNGPQNGPNPNGSKWQDMPNMNMGRGVGNSGPPRAMLPPGGGAGGGGGPKEPWGQPPMRVGGGGSGWGDEPSMPKSSGGGGWGGGSGDVVVVGGGGGGPDMKSRDGEWGPANPDPNNWNKPPHQPGGGGPRGSGPMGPAGSMRSSPNPNWGEMDSNGWGGPKPDMGPGPKMMPGNNLQGMSKENLWNSKPFRMLVEMGYRKDDVESALRTCNNRLEDALEMLNHHRRLPNMDMAQHGGPIGGDPMDNAPGSRHFPGGGGGNSFGAGGDGPLGNPAPLGLNALNRGGPGNPPGMHPGMNNPQSRGQGGQPNPPQTPQGNQQPNQQPSAQQLRLLVQQIQMAVQAGHLNPQILNQPLAPQTLILLNQLLQQIKQLQNLQQQHSMASRQNVNNTALMGVTVKITQTKQTIHNLQNQIQAQQANYLRNPQQQQQQQLGAHPPHMQQQQQQQPNFSSGPDNGATSTMQEMINGLSLMETSNGNGSRLHKWKLSDFPKAPGGGGGQGAQGQGKSASNLLLDNGPWGKGAGDPGNNGGWPETSKSSQSGGGISASSDSNDGIPEFEPGKPWKGPGLKNPDEDPNLTPGSMAAVTIGSIQKPVSVSAPQTSTSATASGDQPGGSLGLTSPTWSFGNKAEVSVLKPDSAPVSSSSNWSTGGSGATSSLTPIGQDLWGSGGPKQPPRAPPGLPTTTAAGSSAGSDNWPPSSGSNGWSDGNNDNPSSAASAWLLLKNLTPQTDGSTLKTLCMQHGPLKHFDLFLNRSIALVMYASGREAAKVNRIITVDIG